METSEARTKLEEQLKLANERIEELEKNLIGLKEFKLKVQGGIETLDMIETPETSEENLNNSET